MNHRGKHLNNLTGFDVVCQAQGQTGHAQVCYGGKTFLKGPENGYNKEIANPYEPGARAQHRHLPPAVLEERTQTKPSPAPSTAPWPPSSAAKPPAEASS